MRIPFNKPFIAGKELYYIAQAVTLGNIGGDGHFTRACAALLEERFGIRKVLMTPSCTAALEMAAMLAEIGSGDEVILPSFTFVSTANAFARLGATPVFVDIRPDTLNLNEQKVAQAVTDRTKAIVAVHYAGIGCELDLLQSVAEASNAVLIEDAAQGVYSTYHGRFLGSVAPLAAFSFHETKNYTCGEGGALCINDPAFIERAEILRDKGTNRQQFFRGEVDRYTWVDVGSSYVPSEVVCAFLYAQLEQLSSIAQVRKQIHARYREALAPLEQERLLRLPFEPAGCTSNDHMFYILLPDLETREELLDHLRAKNIQAVFHYVPLHSSPMGKRLGRCADDMTITERVSDCLVRLPLFYEITAEQQQRVVEEVTHCLTRRGRRFGLDDPLWLNESP